MAGQNIPNKQIIFGVGGGDGTGCWFLARLSPPVCVCCFGRVVSLPFVLFISCGSSWIRHHSIIISGCLACFLP
jgi:hypothetical protein